MTDTPWTSKLSAPESDPIPVHPMSVSGARSSIAELSGQVVSGHGRGKTLGFPTANVASPMDSPMPPDGVYAAWLQVHDERLPAAVSVGANVTFQETEPQIEAHVIGRTDLRLLGTHVTVTLRHRLRDMKRFESIEALVAQMRDDVHAASHALYEEQIEAI